MWLYNACISIWKLPNSKQFNLVQKSSRYLDCNKSYDQLHPGTAAQNSSQIPVGAQGFVGSPSLPACIMIYSYHQMCPALNSKPYWSNKQVVPHLGCRSDAPGSPENRLVICGDRTCFQLHFRSNPSLKSDWKKQLNFCNTSWPKMRPFDTSFLSGLGMHRAKHPCHSESANFFLKDCWILQNLTVFFDSGSDFSSQHQETPLHPGTWQPCFEIKTRKVMMRYPGCPSDLHKHWKIRSKRPSPEEWVKNRKGLSHEEWVNAHWWILVEKYNLYIWGKFPNLMFNVYYWMIMVYELNIYGDQLRQNYSW